MRINIHAGHNPDGRTACGAVGLIKESTEARNVKDKVINLLKSAGHTVYDCTVNDGNSQNDVLSKIVSKCNSHTVDLDVSIHFNAGRNDYKGDGSTGGTEVYVYSNNAGATTYAQNVCNEISALGYRNRGVKSNPGLYVLAKTKAPAMLIECCFVDDADDVKLYSADKMAQAIVKGIIGKTATITATQTNKVSTPTVSYYARYTGASGSLVDAMKTLGINSSFSNRKTIAAKNGISNYSGTAAQNTQLLNLLKQGKLVK